MVYIYYKVAVISLGQKITSIKRLLALNEELIKELIPQIGLRASFLTAWKHLIKTNQCVDEGEVLFFRAHAYLN